MSWVQRRTVISRSPRSIWRSVCTSFFDRGSSPVVGSSMSSNDGAVRKLRAIATFCCWPRDSCFMGWSSVSSGSPRRSRISTTFWRVPPAPRPYRRAAYSMFSHGLSSLKNAASTETRFTCRRTCIASVTTSQPKTRAVPESGVSSVPRILIKVDLPLPFGPRTPVIPPASRRSSSWSATFSLGAALFHQGEPAWRSRRRNALLTPWMSIAGTFITDS